MADQSGKMIIWERLNKLGKWCPYSSDICQFLEENYRNDTSTVNLGNVTEELKIYSVNFKDMIQVSEVTGTKSRIQRRLCDNLCVLGRGFSWQWHDEHDVWNTYDVDVNDYIDKAFQEGKISVSLNKKFAGYPYDIVFSKMIQINKHSKRKRKVRRVANTSPYPVELPSEEVNDSDQKDPLMEVEPSLNPDFLASEIPGTSDLLNQVNAYKRSVENSERVENALLNQRLGICENEASTTPEILVNGTELASIVKPQSYVS